MGILGFVTYKFKLFSVDFPLVHIRDISTFRVTYNLDPYTCNKLVVSWVNCFNNRKGNSSPIHVHVALRAHQRHLAVTGVTGYDLYVIFLKGFF